MSLLAQRFIFLIFSLIPFLYIPIPYLPYPSLPREWKEKEWNEQGIRVWWRDRRDIKGIKIRKIATPSLKLPWASFILLAFSFLFSFLLALAREKNRKKTQREVAQEGFNLVAEGICDMGYGVRFSFPCALFYTINPYP